MIVFHVALNSKSGLGHLSRSMIIAKYLKEKSDVSFAVEKNNQLPLKILRENTIPYFLYEKQDQIANIIDTFPTLTKTIVVDISDKFYVNNPEKLDKYFNQIKLKKINLVVIDGLFGDTIKSKNYPLFDLLIQPYLETDLRENDRALKHLQGKNYVLLNNQYQDINLSLHTKNKVANSILICFGGSDPTSLTAYFSDFIINNFRFLNKTKFTIVLGPHMEEIQKKKIQVKLKNYNSILIKNNIVDLKPLLLENDIAILASGALSRYEAAVCGIHAFIIGINKNHVEQCKLFENFGCAIYLGQQHSLTDENLLKNIILLINDYGCRLKMQKNGLKLIDGKGSFRIAKEIFKLGL